MRRPPQPEAQFHRNSAAVPVCRRKALWIDHALGDQSQQAVLQRDPAAETVFRQHRRHGLPDQLGSLIRFNRADRSDRRTARDRIGPCD